MSNPILSLSAQLRQETWSQHQSLEATEFSRRLLAQTLPIHAYTAQLQAYAPIHAHLEALCAASEHPMVQAVWRDNLRKTLFIQEDLDFFGLSPRPDFPPATPRILDWLQKTSQAYPEGLLGALYVLEGATLGARILHPKVCAMYGLTQAGCAYYGAYRHQTPDHWIAFKARLDKAVVKPGEVTQVIGAARDFFTYIGELFAHVPI